MTSVQTDPAHRDTVSLQALDHLDQAITVVDHELRLVTWNKSFMELLDFPSELITFGVTLEALITYNANRGEYGPGDPEQQIRDRVELAKNFEPHHFERTRPNGTVLEIQGNPIQGIGFVTTYTDITDKKRAEQALLLHHRQLEARVEERTASLKRLNNQLIEEITAHKQTEHALRESEQWIRLITDAVPALISYVGSDLKYQFVNQRHHDLLGLDAPGMNGKEFLSVFRQEQQQGLTLHINQALGGSETHLDLDIDDHKGINRHFRVSLIPHHDEEEAVIGFFFLGQDLTDYKNTQYALYEAQKMQAVGQLTGGIAHDFNNLLTIIIGNLGFLDETIASDNTDDREILDACLNASRRGAELTGRLLAFSRKHPLQSKAVDLNILLLETRELLKRTLAEDTCIDLTIPDNTWFIQVDAGQLEVSLLNLALNSRDAMPVGGQIKIRCRNVRISSAYASGHAYLTPGEYVLVKVSDDGEGIAPEILSRVFEPFFTTKDVNAGSGLGLSMVYGFITQSGGHISIHSTPGNGTAISLYLPRSLIAPVENRSQQKPKSAYQGLEKILLVEDDEDIRQYVKRVLLELGYTVDEAADGPEARMQFKQDQGYDLLLTDISMPGGMNGVELAKKLCQVKQNLKVVYMSGYADKIHNLEKNPRVENRLLQKPFGKTELSAIIRQTLDSPNQQQKQ